MYVFCPRRGNKSNARTFLHEKRFNEEKLWHSQVISMLIEFALWDNLIAHFAVCNPRDCFDGSDIHWPRIFYANDHRFFFCCVKVCNCFCSDWTDNGIVLEFCVCLYVCVHVCICIWIYEIYIWELLLTSFQPNLTSFFNHSIILSTLSDTQYRRINCWIICHSVKHLLILVTKIYAVIADSQFFFFVLFDQTTSSSNASIKKINNIQLWEMFNHQTLIKHHYTSITKIEMSLCPK